jgi:protein-S-isoprenylcysteine O-methyltransferase Ste14
LLFLATGFLVIYLFTETRISKSKRDKGLILVEEDRGSLSRIKRAIFVASLLAFSCAFIPFGKCSDKVYITAGFSILCIGLTIRSYSIIILGKRFTYVVTILNEHPLQFGGLYSIIRHPGYLGQLLILVGSTMLFGNWISVIVTLVILFPSYHYRMTVEEDLILKYKDKEYSDYCKKTYRIIPFVY